MLRRCHTFGVDTYDVALLPFDVPPLLPTVTLTSDLSVPDSPTASKMSGLPYLPAGMDYPQFHGEDAHFLAQFNFAELPRLAGFPERGILQLFTDTFITYGYDPTRPCLARYIEDTTAPSVDYQPRHEYDLEGPFDNPYTAIPLRGVLETSRPNFETSLIQYCTVAGPFPNGDAKTGGVDLASRMSVLQRGRELRILKESGWNVYERTLRPDGGWDEQLDDQRNIGTFDELRDRALAEGFQENNELLHHLESVTVDRAAGHRLGGYPFFVQSDPRTPYSNAVLLAQLDNDWDAGVMWGDNGIVQWFIDADDLARRDFSRVWFHTDCW